MKNCTFDCVNSIIKRSGDRESLNNMKFTELFSLLNARLLNQNNKVTKTIISTNLNLNELSARYGERIISRFIGNYNICYFFGDDIRIKNRI